MSSSHTLVSSNEYNAMLDYISRADAQILASRDEAQRIADLVRQKQREVSEIKAEGRRLTEDAIQSLRATFEENKTRIKDSARSEISRQSENFDFALGEIISSLSESSSKLRGLDSKLDSISQSFTEVFNAYSEKIEDSKTRAESILHQLEQLMSQIEQLSPTKFHPQEYAGLNVSRSMISDNISQGDYNAAIASSQSGVRNASRLWATLIVDNEKYNAKFSDVSERMIALRERFERLFSEESRLSVELNGETNEIDYNADFWSHGRLSELQQIYNECENLLASDSLTMVQLEELSRNVDMLDAQITSCDESARKERAASLFVANTAMQLHSSLAGSGWYISDGSGYVGDDPRQPYHMQYEDNSGNTVSVVVSPQEYENPSFAIEVFSDDDALASITKDSVHVSLQNDGIEIESREVRHDCGNYSSAENFEQSAIKEAQQALSQRRQQRR